MTHFWNPDSPDNLCNINTFHNLPNAWTKVQKYLFGPTNFWLQQEHYNFENHNIYWGYKINYDNLIDLYKTGTFYFKNEPDIYYHYRYNDDHNDKLNFGPAQRKDYAYQILGRIFHLLGDMSVPAHVHQRNHSCTFGAKDSYELWVAGIDCGGTQPSDLNFPGATTLNTRFNKLMADKFFIKDLDSYDDKKLMYFLFYTMAQTADHFTSGSNSDVYLNELGNNSLESSNYDLSYLPPNGTNLINNILSGLGSNIDPQVGNYQNTADNTLNYCVGATATLLYWFAYKTGQIKTPFVENCSNGTFLKGKYEINGATATNTGIYNGRTYFLNHSVEIKKCIDPPLSVLNITNNSELRVCNAILTNNGNGYISSHSYVGNIVLGEYGANGGTGTLVIDNGGELILKAGSTIEIRKNSKLLIKQGGKLTFEPGAKIYLEENDAVLEIQGTLNIINNADFTFSGNGYVFFNGGKITGNGNIVFNGTDRNKTYIKSIGTSLNVNNFTFSNGTIYMSQPLYTTPETNICATHLNLNNAIITGNNVSDWGKWDHSGVKIFQKKGGITSTYKFTNTLIQYGLYGINYIPDDVNPQKLNIQGGLTIDRCWFGINIATGGFDLNNITITNSVKDGIYIDNINNYNDVSGANSFIRNCIINGNNEYGLLVNSGQSGKINIYNSTFNFNINAIKLSGSIRLSLGCNVIKSNSNIGVCLTDNAFLTMHSGYPYFDGNNDISNNFQTIKIENATFDIQNGYNDLTPKILSNTSVNRVIQGHISYLGTNPNSDDCNLLKTNINVDHNKWDNTSQNNRPIQNSNYYTSSWCHALPRYYDHEITLTDAFPLSSYSSCSNVAVISNGGGGIPTPGLAYAAYNPSLNTSMGIDSISNVVDSTFTNYNGGISISTPHFINSSLGDAVLNTLKLTNNNSETDISSAFNLYYEILNNVPLTDNFFKNYINGYLIDVSYTELKDFFCRKIITVQGINENNIYVKNILKIQDTLYNKAKDISNFSRMLSYTLDKAETYRLINRRDKALQIINNIDGCIELDSNQIAYLNRYRTVIYAEYLIDNGFLKSEDKLKFIQNNENNYFKNSNLILNNTIDSLKSSLIVVGDTFKLQSFNFANKYKWDFGDCSSTTDSLTIHLYSYPGIYNINLKEDFNCKTTNSYKKVIVVPKPKSIFSIIYPETKSNVFYFINNTPKFYLSETKCQTDTNSYCKLDSTKIRYSYKWKFGNNSDTLITNLPDTIKYSFSKSGKYAISLSNYIEIYDTTSKTWYNSGIYKSSYDTINFKVPAIARFNKIQYNCLGDTLFLNDQSIGNDPFSYFWDFGDGTTSSQQNVKIKYNQTGNYSVMLIIKDSLSQIDTTIQNISVNQLPVINLSGDSSVCLGNSTTLNVSGASRYKWNFLDTITSSQNITVNPTTTSTYIVIGENDNGCTASSSFITNVKPLEINITHDTIICQGNAIELIPSGGNRYIWNTYDTTSTIIISPENTITYTVTGFDRNGCYGSTQEIVVINKVDFGSNNKIKTCGNSTITLQDNDPYPGKKYLWSTGDTTSNIIVSPLNDQVYKLTATNNGCSVSDSIKVIITPGISLSSSDITICKGDSVLITSNASNENNANIFFWSNGNVKDSIEVRPEFTTSYTVTINNLDNGCSASNNITVNVIDPAPAINNDTTICPGSSVLLSVFPNENEDYSFIWSDGTNNSSINVYPQQTTTYTVTSSVNQTCSAVVQTIIYVNNVNIGIFIDGVDQGNYKNITLCGSTLSFNLRDKNSNIYNSYLWSTGDVLPSIIINPTSNTTYSVTSTKNGCITTDSIIVNVFPAPALLSAGSNEYVCTNNNLVNFIANSNPQNNQSYSWSTGSLSQSIQDNPFTTTTYTVTATETSGCFSTAQVIAIVNGAKIEAIINNNSLFPNNLVNICGKNNTVVLQNKNYQAGNTYIWSTGDTSHSIVLQPPYLQSYSVTVTVNGCTSSDEIFLNSLPMSDLNLPGDISVCPNSTDYISICAGVNFNDNQIFNWSGSDGSNYNQTQCIYVNPTLGTNYTVTMTEPNGCSASKSITVNVSNIMTPFISSDQTICPNKYTNISAWVNGSNCTYSWNNGFSSSNINVAPNFTTTYIVTVNDGPTCSGTAQTIVTVSDKLIPQITPVQTICKGQQVFLSISSYELTYGYNYTWSTEPYDNSTSQNNYYWLNVSPTQTTTYHLSVSGSPSCSGTAQTVVVINSVDLGPDKNIPSCGANTMIIKDKNFKSGNTYLWNTGENASSITLNELTDPSTPQFYTVTLTDENGCTSSDGVTVNVTSPGATVSAGPDRTICNSNNSITLNAVVDQQNNQLYQWNSGETNSSININPLLTTTYVVTVSEPTGCTESAQVVVTVVGVQLQAILDGEIQWWNKNINYCSNKSLILKDMNYNDGNSYQWNTGETTSSISIPDDITGNKFYQVTVTGNGCTSTDGIWINQLKSTKVITMHDTILICPDNSSSILLSAYQNEFNNQSFMWNTGETTQNIQVIPTQSATYTVTMSDPNGCTSTDHILIKVSDHLKPFINGNQTICPTTSVSLNSWIPVLTNVVYSWSDGSISQSIDVTPSTTSTYTVTASNSPTCSGTAQAVINLSEQITPTISPDQSICRGNSILLYASNSNGGYYTWSNGGGGSVINVSPSETTTYTVTVNRTPTCSGTAQVVVTVKGVLLSFNNNIYELCNGSSLILQDYNSHIGDKYLWNTGDTSSSIIVSPSTNQIYRVTSTSNGCTSTDEVAVNVKQFKTVSLDPDFTVCPDNTIPTTINANVSWSDYNQYYSQPYFYWNTGENTQSINVLPSQTTTYTVTMYDNGCTASDSIVVNTSYSLQVNKSPDMILCSGSAGYIDVNAGKNIGYNYRWNTGDTTNYMHVTPSQSTIYTVTVSNSPSCSGTAQVMITVVDHYQPEIETYKDTICVGDAINLSLKDGYKYKEITYIWDNTPWSNCSWCSNINLSPSQTATYKLRISNGTCFGDVQKQITVFGAYLGNKNIINSCGADSLQLIDYNNQYNSISGETYLWSTGDTTPNIKFKTNYSHNYILTVSGNGCTTSDTVYVNITPIGTNVTLQQLATEVCINTPVELTANLSYWNNPTFTWFGKSYNDDYYSGQSGSQQQITVTPASNSKYYVLVTDNNGCTSKSSEITVKVKGAFLGDSQFIQLCGTGSATITDLYAETGETYSWNTGETTSSIIVTPPVSPYYNYYYLTVTGNGCTSTAYSAVWVRYIDLGQDKAICSNNKDSINICINSFDIYYFDSYNTHWNTGNTEKCINVYPTETSTYTVSVNAYNGCTLTDDIIINVDASEVSAGEDQTIECGAYAIITANGTDHYLWNTGQITNTINVHPTVTTTYIVTGSNENGCYSTSQVVVKVIPLQLSAGEDKTICMGSSIKLNSTAGLFYHWDNGSNSQFITVSPSINTTYSITGTNENGCSSKSSVSVTVNTIPLVSAGSDQILCFGSKTMLKATGAGNYLWSNNETSDSIVVFPTQSTTYTVTGTENGCSSTDQVIVSVTNDISFDHIDDFTICKGTNVKFTPKGNAEFYYFTGTLFSDQAQITSFTDLGYLNGENLNGNDYNKAVLESGNTWVDQGVFEYSYPDNTTSIEFDITAKDLLNYNCSYKQHVKVNINSENFNPPSTQVICLGNSIDLSATGGNGSYTWDNKIISQPYTVNPQKTTIYNVQSGSCNANVVVIVKDPVAIINPENATIINGGIVTIEGTLYTKDNTNLIPDNLNAFGYYWHSDPFDGKVNQNINQNLLTVMPSVTTTYTLTIQDNNGCTATNKTIVYVNNNCSGDVSAMISGYNPSYHGEPDIVYNITVSNINGLNQNAKGKLSIDFDPKLYFTQFFQILNNQLNYCDYNMNSMSHIDLDYDIDPNSSAIYQLKLNNGSWGQHNTRQNDILITTVTASTTDSNTIDCINDNNICVAKQTVDIPWDPNFKIVNPSGDCNSHYVSKSDTLYYTIEFENEGNYWATNIAIRDSLDINLDLNSFEIVKSDHKITNYTINNNLLTISFDSIMLPWTSLDKEHCTGYVIYKIKAKENTISGTKINNNANIYFDYNDPIITNKVFNTIVDNFVYPTVNAGADVTIAKGNTTRLSANGGQKFFWSTGETSSVITVSPSVTTTYYVFIDNDGCTASDMVVVSVIDCDSIASGISFSRDKTICAGESINLTASGGEYYIWEMGNEQYSTKQSIEVRPSISSNYIVTVKKQNVCKYIDTIRVYVNPLPLLSTGSDLPICTGQVAKITAFGANTYIWNNGFAGASLCITPLETTSYTVTGTDLNGCSASNSVIVTVNPLPFVSTGSDLTICNGSSTMLSAYGANTYTWNSGKCTDAACNLSVVSPTTTTTYTVTGSDLNGCTASEDVIVNVITVSLNLGSDKTICNGSSNSLTLSGGKTYSWSNGSDEGYLNVTNINGDTAIIVYPKQTTSYIVTGYKKGCSATDGILITVIREKPNAGLPEKVDICLGSSTTLTASGGVYYTWNDDKGISGTSSTTHSITVSPTHTTVYKVTITDQNGCTGEDQVQVEVHKVNANAGVDKVICKGETVKLKATGGSSYRWTIYDGQFITDQTVIVNPTVTSTYYLTAWDVEGCTGTDQSIVTVINCNNKSKSNDSDLDLESSDIAVSVYPNPNSGLFTVKISLSKKSDVDVSMYNTFGIKVYENILLNKEKTFQFDVNIKNVSPGLYLLVIELNNDIKTIEVMKQ